MSLYVLPNYFLHVLTCMFSFSFSLNYFFIFLSYQVGFVIQSTVLRAWTLEKTLLNPECRETAQISSTGWDPGSRANLQTGSISQPIPIQLYNSVEQPPLQGCVVPSRDSLGPWPQMNYEEGNCPTALSSLGYIQWWGKGWGSVENHLCSVYYRHFRMKLKMETWLPNWPLGAVRRIHGDRGDQALRKSWQADVMMQRTSERLVGMIPQT